MKHALNWFEIYVTDFDRAKKFYDTILSDELQVVEAMGMKSGFFSADIQLGGVGGCITLAKDRKPSADGTVVYLNAGDDLQDMLSKVEEAGGKIVVPKTAIGQNGFMAHFLDTEGNIIGLHSRQ